MRRLVLASLAAAALMGTAQADGAPCEVAKSMMIWVLPKPITLNYWIRSDISNLTGMTYSDVARPDLVERAFAAWNSPTIRFHRIVQDYAPMPPGGLIHVVVVADENIPVGAAITYPGWPSVIAIRPSLAHSDDETTYGALLVHEIGHVVGLGHSTCIESIMYPAPGSRMFWETLPAMDMHARDLMYPWPYRVFLPSLNQH